jgi:hypothetical protein
VSESRAKVIHPQRITRLLFNRSHVTRLPLSKPRAVQFLLLVSLLYLGFLDLGSAALQSASDPRFGVDTLTLDTSTGLTWLDLTISRGLSYNQVLAATQPNGAFAGFRIATLPEVTNLFYSAGFVVGFYPESVTTTESIGSLLSLLGQTSSQDGRPETFGITGTSYLGLGHRSFGVDFLYADGVPEYNIWSSGASGDDWGSYSLGTWLVETVPEPATRDLGMLAVFILIGWRCLHHKHNHNPRPTPR